MTANGRTSWAGPYCHAVAPDGTRCPWDPFSAQSTPPAGHKTVVRWRTPGSANPRKVTFRPDQARDGLLLALHIRAAAVQNAVPGPDGRPPALNGPRPVADPTAAAAPATVQPHGDKPSLPTPPTVVAAPVSKPHRNARSDASPARAPDEGGLGVTIEEYVDELIAANLARWNQTGIASWHMTQFAAVVAAYQYADDDPRIATHGVTAGGSKHLRLLHAGDFRAALQARRAVNLAAKARNASRKTAYDRKLATWQANRDRLGNAHRAARPQEPTYENAANGSVLDQPMISPASEKHFANAQSAVFDRAFDEGLFGTGANPWRLYKPRGNGGRRSARASDYRAIKRTPASDRDFPGAGFFIDLRDALALVGERDQEGRWSGERYRELPFLIWQLALRPPELGIAHVEHLPPPSPVSHTSSCHPTRPPRHLPLTHRRAQITPQRRQMDPVVSEPPYRGGPMNADSIFLRREAISW